MASLTKPQINSIFKKVREGTASQLEIQLANKLYLHSVQSNYSSFCKAIFPENYWFNFQKYLMGRIDRAIKNGNGFLVISMPPQHGKTTLGSTLLVPYIHGRYPDKKVILTAYGSELAKKNARDIASIMGMESYKKIFPTRLKKTWDEEVDDMFDRELKQTSHNWNLSSDPRGSFLATSIGGVLTGETGDILILDDYNKDSSTAKSITERQNTFDWFSTSFMTRKQVNSLVVVFATRWHSDDLIGRLLLKKREEPEIFNFDYIHFSALQTIEGMENDYDPRDFREPLWPDKLKDYLYQRALSEFNFMALYQGIPPTEIGVMFDRGHFVEYAVRPERFDQIVMGVDTSYKAHANESDDCAMVILGRINDKWYLIEYVARRMTFMETLKVALELCEKYGIFTVVVEEKMNGVPLMEMMQDEMPGIDLIGCDMGPMSKRAKAEMTTPTFATSRFYIPTKELYPQVEKYLNQFLQFTGEKGGKDDLVDATVVILLKLGQLEYRIARDVTFTQPSLGTKLLGVPNSGKKYCIPYPTTRTQGFRPNGLVEKNYVSNFIR